MKPTRKELRDCAEFLARKAGACIFALTASPTFRRATIYLDPDLTVKATRQRRVGRRDRQVTFIVTIGKPNYRERRFVRACRKAREPFPVRKVQIQEWKAR